MIQAIERAVWFHLEGVTVSHVVNDHDQPELVIARSTPHRRTIRVSLACFCVEPESPWVDQGTKIEDIAVSVCSTVMDWMK